MRGSPERDYVVPGCGRGGDRDRSLVVMSRRRRRRRRRPWVRARAFSDFSGKRNPSLCERRLTVFPDLFARFRIFALRIFFEKIDSLQDSKKHCALCTMHNVGGQIFDIFRTFFGVFRTFSGLSQECSQEVKASSKGLPARF